MGPNSSVGSIKRSSCGQGSTMDDQQAEEAPSCRVCWAEEPPRGLADLLLDQPCGCRGHMARIHLSCLHAWQLQRLNPWPLGDVTRCDVCRQPYNVPEQLWDELVAAGGIPAGERQRVQEQQQRVQDFMQQQGVQDPGQLWQLDAQQWAQDWEELGQALQRALHQLPNPAQQQQLRQELLQALAHPQQPEQQAVQRAGGGEPGAPSALQALAQALHGARTGGGWLLKPIKTFCWLWHGVVHFIDSSELPANEPPRPPLWRRLLPDVGVAAGVLGLLAVSERRQLGSWLAVWQRGYSAWYVRRAALPFALLALCTVVQRQAGADRSAPGAPAHQRPLAAVADDLAELSLLCGSLAVTYWPSLLSCMGWLPRAAWAVVCTWLPCLLLKPAAPVRWPAMRAVLEGLRLNRLWGIQMREDAENATTANLCLALLQQSPGSMRRFVDALSPIPTPSFTPAAPILTRFLSIFAPSL